MSYVKFENVKKVYHMGEVSIEALRDATFEIEKGEICVITGASGAGKTTLLNILGGMDTLTEGRIFLDGKEISALSERNLTSYRRYDIGFVFQFYNLIPTLTAYENVALMKDIVNDTMDPKQALEAVGLGDHMHQFPAQMSGGEQQRTSIARAIAKNPKLLLCDEPTGALDTNTGRDVLELLVSMSREQKKTVVMVTHNSFFADIADKVIRVKNGGIESVTINEHPKDASEVSW